MNAPEVSIVMPVWNAASSLDAAVQSILHQSFSDLEVILWDDGSTDESPAIARRWAQRDSRIRLMVTSHKGIVAALRLACAQSRGRYIARMDADDTAHPERIARQFALMESDSDVALCGTHVRMCGAQVGSGRLRYESWINALTTHEAIVREIFVECPIAHPTFFMRRDAFDAVGGYRDAGWAEDYDLCMRFWRAGYCFAKVDAVLLDWHERDNRHSMVHPRYDPAQFRALKRHYLEGSYLGNLPAPRRFFQWGAGEVGKIWLREWKTYVPEGVIDINPRKIGTKIHDFHVLSPEGLPPPGQVFVTIAVGAPGAREDIRSYLNPRGYRECQDYLFVA